MEILLFQLHSFFIGYIEVPSEEQLAGIPRGFVRVNEAPVEVFCHAAMKIKLVRCVTGKFFKSVQQGKEGDLSAVPSHHQFIGPMSEHVTCNNVENKL